MEEINQIANGVETNQEEPEPITLFAIAGFWRRLIAFIVDGFIISIPLLIVAMMFKNIAYSLGPYGRIFGYTIVIAYWTLYHSYRHNGQTLGKRWLKIAVVDHQGKPLTFRKSFWRALILALIMALSGWALPFLQNPIMAFITTIIVFGGGFAFYNLVFNRTTRQGTHDLLVGTYVVHQPSPNSEAILPTMPKIHRQVTYGIIGLTILLAIGGLYFQMRPPTSSIVTSSEWKEIQNLQANLEQKEGVFSAEVKRVNRTSFNTGNTLKDLNIEVWINTPCSHNRTYCDELVDEIARMVFAEYDQTAALDGMSISVINQVDFGIASHNSVQGIAWSMEDWQKYLNE